MKLRQLARNHMYKKVLGFFNANTDAFLNFERLKTQIEVFTELNITLDNCIEQQAKTSAGFTLNKNHIFDALIADTVKVARKALVYAVDQNDTVLKELFNVYTTTLVNSPENVALARIQNIYDGLSGLEEVLSSYKINAADIAAVYNGILAFKVAQPGTGNARAVRKAGTQGILSTMASIDVCITVLDNLIVYGIDDAELVNEYRNNRKIDTIGVRHTGIVAVIDDAITSDVIAGVKMEITALNKSAVSNLAGVAEITPMKPGVYEVLFAAAGFVSHTMILKIERGVKMNVRVRLLSQVGEIGLVKAA